MLFCRESRTYAHYAYIHRSYPHPSEAQHSGNLTSGPASPISLAIAYDISLSGERRNGPIYAKSLHTSFGLNYAASNPTKRMVDEINGLSPADSPPDHLESCIILSFARNAEQYPPRKLRNMFFLSKLYYRFFDMAHFKAMSAEDTHQDLKELFTGTGQHYVRIDPPEPLSQSKSSAPEVKRSRWSFSRIRRRKHPQTQEQDLEKQALKMQDREKQDLVKQELKPANASTWASTKTTATQDSTMTLQPERLSSTAHRLSPRLRETIEQTAEELVQARRDRTDKFTTEEAELFIGFRYRCELLPCKMAASDIIYARRSDCRTHLIAADSVHENLKLDQDQDKIDKLLDQCRVPPTLRTLFA
jgi:hypothetical protein